MRVVFSGQNFSVLGTISLCVSKFPLRRKLTPPLRADQNSVCNLYVSYTGLFACRGLLDDDNFHQRMAEISQEPVPYFRQLCETQYTTSSRPSSASSQSSNQSRSGEEVSGEMEAIPSTSQVAIKIMLRDLYREIHLNSNSWNCH